MGLEGILSPGCPEGRSRAVLVDGMCFFPQELGTFLQWGSPVSYWLAWGDWYLCQPLHTEQLLDDCQNAHRVPFPCAPSRVRSAVEQLWRCGSGHTAQSGPLLCSGVRIGWCAGEERNELLCCSQRVGGKYGRVGAPALLQLKGSAVVLGGQWADGHGAALLSLSWDPGPGEWFHGCSGKAMAVEGAAVPSFLQGGLGAGEQLSVGGGLRGCSVSPAAFGAGRWLLPCAPSAAEGCWVTPAAPAPPCERHSPAVELLATAQTPLFLLPDFSLSSSLVFILSGSWPKGSIDLK